MAGAHLVTDGAVIAELMRGPRGPVGRYLMERATVFQAAARRQAPRRTGCLQDSIVKRMVLLDGGLAIFVVSDTKPCSPTRTSYSLFVHEGSQPHDIFAKNPSNLLVFTINGATVFVNTSNTPVHHPGTRANRFLSDNLHLFGTEIV
jgi:hypothetical protein